MSSDDFPHRTVGIYRNLPTFSPSLSGLHALVCGATGISGFHAVRALLDSPKRWTKIYCVSRSPLSDKLISLLTEAEVARLQHVPVDLTSTSDDIAKSLIDANVQADYVFFYAFANPSNGTSNMDPNNADDLAQVNVPLFGNFLGALAESGIRPKRILLQTGGKNYGMHLGRVRNPLLESDDQPKHLQTNFYYGQEKLLFDYCEAHPETGWNVVRPVMIIGAIDKTWLNAFYAFSVYAAVQAKKGEPLEFGGAFEEWQFAQTHSSARMTGYVCEWAVLNEKTRNQAFNASDDSPVSPDRLFHELARWYGVEKGVKLPSPDETRVFNSGFTLPGGSASPLGYGPPVKMPLGFSLVDWAKKPESREAWNQIVESEPKLAGVDPFEPEHVYQIFAGDFLYLRFGMISLNKLRRFGFTGYVDTVESVFEMFQEMAKMGLMLPTQVSAAKPLV